MEKTPKLLFFHELHEPTLIPNHGGLYAWYYQPRLTTKDLDTLLFALKHVPDGEERAALIRKFLEKHLFSPYQEPPYNAHMSAPLRPEFRGELAVQSPVSASLVSRIEQDPDRSYSRVKG